MRRGEGLEVGGADGGQAFRVAIDGVGIGMIAEIDAVEAVGGDRGGIARVLRDGLEHLCAHALDRIGVEARMPERQRDEAEGVPRLRRQRADRQRQPVAVGRHRKLNGAVGDLGLIGFGSERAGAFVEQVRGEGGEAGLAGGIVGRAGGQRDADGDHRHGVIFLEPDLLVRPDVERARRGGDSGRGEAEREQQCEGERLHAGPGVR